MSRLTSLSRREFLAGTAGAALAATARRSPAGRPRPDQPNIVFLFTDQQQGAAWSAAGNPALRTPAMDSVARGGVRFAGMHCATPQCSAARASIVTGRWPHSAGVVTNIGAIGSKKLDPEIPSAGFVFREAGYETAWFGKWHLGNDPTHYGFEHFDHAKRGEGDLVREAAVEFLEHRHDKPFVMYASFVNPHDIYGFKNLQNRIELGKREIELPASRRDDLSEKPRCQKQYLEEDQGRVARGFGDDEWRKYLEVYYHLTEKVDGQIGRILETLRRQGLERDTIVVFTSDHGDLAGGHGLPFKGPCMYRELMEVPLAIRWPGTISEGGVRRELVGHVDLLPTLCDLAGIEPPEGMQGRSLRPLLMGEKTPWREFIVGEYYSKQRWANPIRMMRTDRFKYVRYRHWIDELYDLQKDPDEMKNLASILPGLGDYSKTIGWLSDELDRWMKETGDNFGSLEPTDRAGNAL
jgi:arylsulfatase A-like enzyme